jgi:putative FmdB family regulatory protein
MPLFDYRCAECGRRFTVLVGVTADSAAPSCPSCGSSFLRKLVSRFAIARSAEAVLDRLEDEAALGDPEDPRAMAQWMRRVGHEFGEDLGDDFEAMAEEAAREEATAAARSVDAGEGEEGPGSADGGIE